MKKVSELEGAELDYFVARAEKIEAELFLLAGCRKTRIKEDWVVMSDKYSPSTDWSQGGPIIERENMDLDYWENAPSERKRSAFCDGYEEYGPTILIAAMRAYVASKFGDEVN